MYVSMELNKIYKMINSKQNPSGMIAVVCLNKRKMAIFVANSRICVSLQGLPARRFPQNSFDGECHSVKLVRLLPGKVM